MSEPRLQNLAALVDRAATRFGDAVFLPRRDAKGGEPTTFRQLADAVREVAAGLLALDVRRGDRVGLISENRREWLIADLACARIGAPDVPRGTDTAPAELAFLLGHANCQFVFVETMKAARELSQLRAQLPNLGTFCVLAERSEDPDILDFDRLRERGRAFLAAHPGELDRVAAQVGREDLLTVIYTSGTTANPKGVTLTHGNLLSNIEMVEEVLHFDREDTALSILPSWHSYERIMDYVLLYAGSQLVYSDRRRLREDLRAVQPTIFVAVPRVWEMLYDGIIAQCRKQVGIARKIVDRVLANCRAIGAGRAGIVTRLSQKVLGRSVLPKLRQATGGRLRIAVSGGGSLPAHVDESLLGMGIPLLNGYGLTETSPVVALRRLEHNRAYTIGPPLPRTQCEIRDESGHVLPPDRVGIIWIRGPQVMQGYWNNVEQTANVLIDGWFNSGDLGCIDSRGELRITGRAKDTIVLAGGENVEPDRLETQLKTSPFIDQVVVLGQDQKHLGALLVINAENLSQEIAEADWENDEGVLRSDAVQRLLRREIDRLVSRAQGFRPSERIASFRALLEPMTAENGLMTQTMKIRRHIVNERYAPLIAELFAASTDEN
ncbi:MAG: long-chain fatty acid--CoA ligase [Planctomycetota bacterium]